MTVDKLVKVTPTVGAPTLSGGRPSAWHQTGAPTRTDWGVWRVFFAGTDITEYGEAGKRTSVPTRWTYLKPHWFGEATVELAKVSGYESEPSWLANGKDVRLRRETSPGVFSTDPRDEWRGFVEAYGDGDKGGTRVELRGLYQQPDLYKRAPAYSEDPVEIGVQWQGNLDLGSRPAYRWPSNPSTPTTGTNTTQHGQWESVLEYLSAIGAAVPGWTWRPASDFTPTYVDTAVSPGSSWTVRYGAFGCEPGNVDLRKELRASPNVIYAEGFVDGEPWQLIVVNSSGDIFHAPLSADPVVHTLFYDPTTNGLTTNAASFDATVLRIEAIWKLPPGMDYTTAKAMADAFRSKVADPGWSGTIRLDAWDLLDMRPDDTLTLQGYRGADRTLHIAGVDFDWNNGSPTASLTVDTNARDLATVNAILDGNWDRATNPFYGIQIGRESGLKRDEKARWSAQTGSGWGPNDDTHGHRNKDGTSTFAVTCGQWNELIFPASEEDTIMYSQIVCSTDGAVDVGGAGGTGRAFTAIVTDRTLALPPDVTSPLPADPSLDGVWDAQTISDCGVQQGWGWYHDGHSDKAGYGHVAFRHEYSGDPITGQMVDNESWNFTHGDLSLQPGANRLVVYLFPYEAGAAECWFQFVRKGAP